MKSLSSLVILALSLAAVSAEAPPRERISLNAGWQFQKGDPDDAAGKLDYPKIKDWLLPSGNEFTKDPAQRKLRPEGNPGADVAFTQPTFDDSSWSKVALPHDWAIAGPFDQKLLGDTGKLPFVGVGWYRKHLEVAASDAGRRFQLEIDGAMSYSAVWCNGQLVGGWPYGYASYQLDLTPYLKPGSDNVLAIRLDNPDKASRWYPGAGLYRNVWLTRTAPVHATPWGTAVTAPKVSPEAADIEARVSVDNTTATEAAVTIEAEVREVDEAGKPVGPSVKSSSGSLKVTIAASGKGTGTFKFSMPQPKLWTLETPKLYAAIITIAQDGKTIDQNETHFGIRSIQFTADNGFLLNGRRVPLHGVCMHHDLGALGAAFNTRAAERQLEILKEMGVNALRTSHNMPAPELLDLCDRMGIVVMDESFDCWQKGKNANDYHVLFDDWHEQDMRAEVRRDRNHPSVILYSIGNEIPQQASPEGVAIAKELTAIIHEEDPTRPSTIACSSIKAGYSDLTTGVDVFGYNYKPGDYAKWHAAHPAQPLFGSETSSTVSSRGEYFFPLENAKNNFQVSSYDLWKPGWATLPETEFKGQDDNPFVAGEFVWTGFDYLGEPTPFQSRELKGVEQATTPSRSSYFGIVDLAGFKKDRFYLYQARWKPELAMAHILPHWNWPQRVGQVTPVHVYTSGDEVELFLNKQSLGRKKKGPRDYRLRWDEVKYAAGELRAVAYKNGKKWAQDAVATTGAPAKIVAKADRPSIQGDARDLSFITVTVLDRDGRTVPDAKNLVTCELSGPGEIVAVDNGDATSHSSFQAKEISVFNGMALVIVRGMAGESGPITLKLAAEGLVAGTVQLQTVARQ